MLFTDFERNTLERSLKAISINAMPRVGGRSTMLQVCDPAKVRNLALEVLAKLVECFEIAKNSNTPATALYERCILIVATEAIRKICLIADKSKLPKYLSQVRCEKLIQLAGNNLTADELTCFRIKHEPKDNKLHRIIIKSDILSSLTADELPKYDTLLQIHMTDRLGLLFLMLVAVHNTPYEYSLDETQLQIGGGSTEDNTNGSHICAVPQFQRQARGVNSPVQKRFLAEMYLYLSMNRVNRLKRLDNEVDMKLEPRMRPAVIKMMNETAKGRLVTSCFERAVGKIKKIVQEIKQEWKDDKTYAEKFKGLLEQEKGIDNVIDPSTQKVDPEFYRMNGRIIDDKLLQKQLKEHQWTELSPGTQNKIILALQNQILSHSAVPYLTKRSPTLLSRLK